MNKKVLYKRRRAWETLFKKYELRGQINTKTISLKEISYKHFARPKLKNQKRKICNKNKTVNFLENMTENCINKYTSAKNCIIDNAYEMEVNDTDNKNTNIMFVKDIYPLINVTDLIDGETAKKDELINKENNRSRCIILDDFYDHNINFNLIKTVEVTLQSNLKNLLLKRGESKILESTSYNLLHDYTKLEMKRLRKYISKSDLKEYMRYCHLNNIDMTLLQDTISNKIKSNFKDLLIRREYFRHDKYKFLKYCEKIYDEWQKIIKVVPIEYMILYASNIIHSIQEGKERTRYSSEDNSSNCRLLLEEHSISETEICS